MAAADIRPGDRVLDIGCGTGQTTRQAARASGAGSAMSVDLSAQMIELARGLARAHNVNNVGFEQADAQIHPFPGDGFDVAISRTGTMFFGDPTAAFANIARAVRTGGRLALLTWQGPERNEWIRELSGALAVGRDRPVPPRGVPGPFAQADPDQVKAVLSGAGFGQIRWEGLSGPMRFGADADGAYAFVLGLMGWMLEGLDHAQRQQAVDRLRDTICQHATAGGVTSRRWCTPTPPPRIR